VRTRVTRDSNHPYHSYVTDKSNDTNHSLTAQCQGLQVASAVSLP